MTIYIDIIFLENLFMNCIILYATGTILKAPIKIWRIIVSSVIGSIYSVLLYISVVEFYSNIILKTMLSIAMVYIAFNSKFFKTFLKQLIVFYLTSFTFGGVAFFLLYFVDSKNILLENGTLIGIYPIKIILVAGIIGFIIIVTAFKNIKGKISKKDLYCKIKINIDSKYAYTNAIIDTGNFLKDPISKIPVIVTEKEVLKDIIPEEILENLDKIVNGKDIELKEYISKMRIIPFTSLGKENGILVGIKAEYIIINTGENNIKIDNIIVGIYGGKLSKNGKYKALIGLELLENKEGGYYYDEYIGNIKI